LTEKAFERGNNIASTRSLELLVRLSGKRQIKKALEELTPKSKAVLVVFGKNARRCFEKALEDLKAREETEKLSEAGWKDAVEGAVLVG
jgi:tRNA threonylcarbamoyladenosine modification (KEOPS) complex Cgi121 subunit